MPSLARPALSAGTLAGRSQPELESGGIRLRPWQLTDVPEIVAAYADPSIQRWHARTMTTPEAAAWVVQWTERWSAETGASWAVTDGERLLGRMGLNAVGLPEAVAEVAYWVVPDARGRGVAHRALTTMTAWCHDVGFHRLELEHAVGNIASCRVAARSGFAVEGVRRQSALHADGWHDMHLHGRLATDGVRPGPALTRTGG